MSKGKARRGGCLPRKTLGSTIRIMTEPEQVVICEETGVWATAMRRLVTDLPLAVTETRSLASCLDPKGSSEVVFLMVEVRRFMLDDLVPWSFDVRRRWGPLPWVAVAPRAMRRSEWFLREAGATHVIFSLRQMCEVVHVLRRHLRVIGYRPKSRSEQAFDRQNSASR